MTLMSEKLPPRELGREPMHRFAVVTAFVTWILLIAGGLVTSTDSGLAVPDWPLSYGTLFPPMVGGIAYEHSHRVIAGVVALMIAALALWLWRGEPRRWVRRLGLAAAGMVVAQAALGGLTVLLVLPPPISIAHACLGQLVFCVVSAVALAGAPMWSRPLPRATRGLRMASAAAAALLFVQLVLGAVIRHSGAGVMWHVGGAFAVMLALGLTVGLAARQWRSAPTLVRLAWSLAAGLAMQLGLGVLVLLSGQHPALATAHVGIGALLLAGSVLLAMLAWRPAARQPAEEPSAQAALDAHGAAADSGAAREFGATPRSRLSDFAELAKTRLTALAVASAAVGFLLGAARPLDVWLLLRTLLGAVLAGAGSNALNQWYERETDALMRRTASRPLPSGRMRMGTALAFGLVSSALGIGVLACAVHPVAGLLALLTLVSYVGVYTPLKRVTSLCTLVGAIPGALPPLIGWAATGRPLTTEAWVLFAIVFLWQLPHFLAIAWVHREDYARAGFPMLPVVEPDGASTARQMVLYGLALLPISLLPSILRLAGMFYFAGALIVGGWFLAVAIAAARLRTHALATRLFFASVAYLPVLLGLLVIDRVPV